MKMRKDWQKFGSDCYANFSGNDNYVVQFFGDALVVNLVRRTCSCGLYQLRGYPCVHAIAAIEVRRNDWHNYVDDWYSKDKYLETYTHMISPVPGPKYYLQTNRGKIQPPCGESETGEAKESKEKGWE